MLPFHSGWSNWTGNKRAGARVLSPQGLESIEVLLGETEESAVFGGKIGGTECLQWMAGQDLFNNTALKGRQKSPIDCVHKLAYNHGRRDRIIVLDALTYVADMKM